jgi:hypothetical protein
MTACRCDAEPTYGSNPHRRGGDRFKTNRTNPPLGGGDVLQTAGFRSERWFRISALTESHCSSAVYTPIRFKKIVTSAPRPAAALCCSGHMSLRALGGVRSCMQLNRFWFIPRNRVAPAPCQCCHCCGMNAAANRFACLNMTSTARVIVCRYHALASRASLCVCVIFSQQQYARRLRRRRRRRLLPRLRLLACSDKHGGLQPR